MRARADREFLRRAVGPVVAGGALLAACLTVSAPALARALEPALLKPGSWTSLGSTGLGMTPVVYEQPNDDAVVLWETEPTPNRFTFERAVVGPDGGVLDPRASIFGTSYWGSLNGAATMVPTAGGAPLLVFSGTRSNLPKDPFRTGCIVGALGTSMPWALQSWSLSANCIISQSDAARGGNGQVAAAWPGGWAGGHGFRYRLQPSAADPALGNDLEVPLASTAGVVKLAVTADNAGNGDVWLYWGQEVNFGQSPSDGWYAKDLTSNGPVRRAPGSVRGSTDLDVFARPAFASTNTHPGVFAAYDVPPKSPGYINCSQGQHCTLELWRVGASKATSVTGAVGAMADNVALSAGPGGRLWIAWVDSNHHTVNVVRTNEADNRFSAVRTYPMPCTGYGIVGLSGGSWQRLDIVLECPTKSAPLAELFTQSLPSLSLAFTPTVPNTSAQSWHFRVTDVGDPVPGATVQFGKLTATTGASGEATIVIPKGQAPGSYTVTATAPNYYAATGALTVTT